jgi:hypothetical protein
MLQQVSEGQDAPVKAEELISPQLQRALQVILA